VPNIAQIGKELCLQIPKQNTALEAKPSNACNWIRAAYNQKIIDEFLNVFLGELILGVSF